ncbi:hypothetical protein C0J52_16533 [Blattella germanica]|nr:hypothetical protein C0J52_16533 [Blattella germanica]
MQIQTSVAVDVIGSTICRARTNVKRVRIPRPKFASARHAGAMYPIEPPKDYSLGSIDDPRDEKSKRNDFTGRELAKATEELRRAVQEKL